CTTSLHKYPSSLSMVNRWDKRKCHLRAQVGFTEGLARMKACLPSRLTRLHTLLIDISHHQASGRSGFETQFPLTLTAIQASRSGTSRKMAPKCRVSDPSQRPAT